MALTGDEISRLYAEHSAALLRHVARRTWDPELAVDLVGETFARAFEQRARFRGAPVGCVAVRGDVDRRSSWDDVRPAERPVDT